MESAELKFTTLVRRREHTRYDDFLLINNYHLNKLFTLNKLTRIFFQQRTFIT